MAKVITLSRTFPPYHPRKGEPTHFAEKVLKSIYPNVTHYPSKCENCGWQGMSNCLDGGGQIADTGDYGDALCPKCWRTDLDGELGSMEYLDRYYLDDCGSPKHHTIRGGRRFKNGELASLRLWSGKPYRSPQFSVAQDIEIRVFDFEIDRCGVPSINGSYIDDATYTGLATNDGLSEDDLYHWFKPSYAKADFIGQIICWNPEIKY